MLVSSFLHQIHVNSRSPCRSLHANLIRLRSSPPSPAVDEIVVDTIKQISELMVYGDKHAEAGFFEFFCEKGLLRTLVEIFRDSSYGSGVRVQIIQSMSILLMNIQSPSSLFYLLSNNHVNDLITSRIDPSDEDLLAYYVSFLKTLSLSVNPGTVQFFLQGGGGKKSRVPAQQPSASAASEGLHGSVERTPERPSLTSGSTSSVLSSVLTAGSSNDGAVGGAMMSPSGGYAIASPVAPPAPAPARPLGSPVSSVAAPTFPLYTEAIRYAHHPDPLTRTTVRTLTLNIYNVNDAGVRTFLSQPGPHATYHPQLATHVRSAVLRMSGLVASLGNLAGTTSSSGIATAGGTGVDWSQLMSEAETARHRPGCRCGLSASCDYRSHAVVSVTPTDILAHNGGVSNLLAAAAPPAHASPSPAFSVASSNNTISVTPFSSTDAAASAGGSAFQMSASALASASFYGQPAAGSSSPEMRRDLQQSISDQLSELVTLLLYIQDILAVGQKEIDSAVDGSKTSSGSSENRITRKGTSSEQAQSSSFVPIADKLCDALLDAVVKPLLLHSLTAAAYPSRLPAGSAPSSSSAAAFLSPTAADSLEGNASSEGSFGIATGYYNYFSGSSGSGGSSTSGSSAAAAALLVGLPIRATVPWPGLVPPPDDQSAEHSGSGGVSDLADHETANNPFLHPPPEVKRSVGTAGAGIINARVGLPQQNQPHSIATPFTTGLPSASCTPIVVDPCLALCVLLHMTKAIKYRRFQFAVQSALFRYRLAVPSPLLGEVSPEQYWGLLGISLQHISANTPSDGAAGGVSHPLLTSAPPVHPAFLQAAKRNRRNHKVKAAGLLPNGKGGHKKGVQSLGSSIGSKLLGSRRARSSSANGGGGRTGSKSDGPDTVSLPDTSLADAYDELFTAAELMSFNEQPQQQNGRADSSADAALPGSIASRASGDSSIGGDRTNSESEGDDDNGANGTDEAAVSSSAVISLPSRHRLFDVFLMLLQSSEPRLVAATSSFLLALSRIPHIDRILLASTGLLSAHVPLTALSAVASVSYNDSDGTHPTIGRRTQRSSSIISDSGRTGPRRSSRTYSLTSSANLEAALAAEVAASAVGIGISSQATDASEREEARPVTSGAFSDSADSNAQEPPALLNAPTDSQFPSNDASGAPSLARIACGARHKLVQAVLSSLLRCPPLPCPQYRYTCALLLRLVSDGPAGTATSCDCNSSFTGDPFVVLSALQSSLAAVSAAIANRLDTARTSSYPSNALSPLLHILEALCESEGREPSGLADALAVACENAGISAAAVGRDFCGERDCGLPASEPSGASEHGTDLNVSRISIDSNNSVSDLSSPRSMTGEQLKLQAAARETLRKLVDAAVVPPLPSLSGIGSAVSSSGGVAGDRGSYGAFYAHQAARQDTATYAADSTAAGNDDADDGPPFDVSQLLDDVESLMTPGLSPGSPVIASAALPHNRVLISASFYDLVATLLRLRAAAIAVSLVAPQQLAASQAPVELAQAPWVKSAVAAVSSLLSLCRLPSAGTAFIASDHFAVLTATAPLPASSSSPLPSPSSSSSSAGGGGSAGPTQLPPFWDASSKTLCLDPLLKLIAPPADSIRPGNSFSLQRLPWFSASCYPVALNLPSPPVGPPPSCSVPHPSDHTAILAPLAQAASAAGVASLPPSTPRDGGAGSASSSSSTSVSGSGSASASAGGSGQSGSGYSQTSVYSTTNGTASAIATATPSSSSAPRRVGVVLGSSYLVLAELLQARTAIGTPSAAASAPTAATNSAVPEGGASSTGTGGGNDGAAASVTASTAAALYQRGRALAVVPLHFTFTTVPPKAPHVVDVRFVTRAHVALSRHIAAVTGEEAPQTQQLRDSTAAQGSSVLPPPSSITTRLPLDVCGFCLVLESAELASITAAHVDAARRRVVEGKLAATRALLLGM